MVIQIYKLQQKQIHTEKISQQVKVVAEQFYLALSVFCVDFAEKGEQFIPQRIGCVRIVVTNLKHNYDYR